MSLRSPLGKFLGLGSAKEGTHHWWSQRLTAIAMVPLGIWFVFALLGMDSYSHAAVAAWLAEPLHAILLILLLLAVLYHAQLGLQVVVEDYVHSGLKIVILTLSKFAHVAAAVAAVYSIIILSVGTA